MIKQTKKKTKISTIKENPLLISDSTKKSQSDSRIKVIPHWKIGLPVENDPIIQNFILFQIRGVPKIDP